MSLTVFKDKYSKKEEYLFPDQTSTDPRKKSLDEYCIRVIQAIYSAYVRGATSLSLDQYKEIQTLRDYGMGNQNPELYMPQEKNEQRPTGTVVDDTDGSWTTMSRTSTHQYERKGMRNMDRRIVSIARNIKNTFLGMFQNYEEDIFVNNIDEDSGAEERDEMAKAAIEATQQQWLGGVRSRVGLPLDSSNVFPSSVTTEELDMFFKAGGFKLNYARIMEKLLRYTEKKSEWEQNIKPKFIHDLIDLNFICGRVYYDTETGEERWGYLDPSFFGIQYSKERDFADAEYAWYWELVTISKLRSKGFPEDKLNEAALKYTGFFGNPEKTDWKSYEGENKQGILKYSGFKVPVLHTAWIDTDVSKALHYTNVWGKKRIIDLGFDQEVKPLSERQKKRGAVQKIVSTHKRIVYQGSLVVDTDMIYDHGISPNQARKSMAEPSLPFFAYRGVKTNEDLKFGSLTEAMIPFLDGLHMAYAKFRNSLRNVIDNGYAINLRLLANMQMGGKDLSEEAAIEMFKRSALLPFMDTIPGYGYKGGDVLPIHPIPGGLGTRLVETIDLMKFNLNMISEITGLAPVALSRSPEQDTPVTTVKMQLSGTNNAVRPIIEGLYEIKEDMALASSKRIQLAVRNVDVAYKNYKRVVGEADIEEIKKGHRLGIDYGINLEARPDEEEKLRILKAAEAALQRGRDGEAQIDLDVYIYIEEQIMGDGSLKEMRQKLMFAIKKEKEYQQMIKERNIQLQNQGLMQIEQQKAQKEMQMQKEKGSLELQLKQTDIEGQKELKMIDANIEYLNNLIEQLKEGETKNELVA